MKEKPKVGLLPLYLALYDETDPDRREKFGSLLDTVAETFVVGGVEVVRAEICCVEPEFREAVALFEKEDVDLLVALHLAYSPSLESAAALVATPIPILFLDTTMDFDFGPTVDPSRIAYNHGIHGVQDLASVLRRRGKAFEIVAGHVSESDVLARAQAVALAAHAARRFRRTRVLRIGDSFRGMGDFSVADSLIEQDLGVSVEQIDAPCLAKAIRKVSKEEVAEEAERDRERFDVEVGEEVYQRSLRVSLGLRRLLDRRGFTAFSMNFLAFDTPNPPVNVVPFLEASKAMARGIGYAGEGDVVTAALVGALGASYGSVTFTEIFCPDWRNGALFLSHMGEINPEVAAAKPRMVELDFPYSPALNPAVLACGMAPGRATLVNLAPGPDYTFELVVARAEVLPEPEETTMGNCIRGWIRPAMPLHNFLEKYSRVGGTHHSALVYGDRLEELRSFGAFVGLPVRIVG